MSGYLQQWARSPRSITDQRWCADDNPATRSTTSAGPGRQQNNVSFLKAKCFISERGLYQDMANDVRSTRCHHNNPLYDPLILTLKVSSDP